MRALTLVISAAALAMGGAAVAQDRLTDDQYVKLARCAVIAEKADKDGAALQARLRAEADGRSGTAKVRAAQAEDNAAMVYAAADRKGRKAMQAELDGACAAILSGGGTVQANLATAAPE